MNSFNILSPSTPVHRSYLLEASAGTGKTFSIENVVARLILEEDPSLGDAMPIEKILVVTFTRAATRDLKERVRGTLQKVLCGLKAGNGQAMEYVEAILAQGEAAVKKGIRRVEQALFSFDQAQIFTIHAFCARMLRDYGFEAGVLIDGEEEQLSNSQIARIIRDFFRTELHPDAYSPQQLKNALKYKNFEELESTLLKQIKRGFKIAEIPPFSADLVVFQEAMGRLASEEGFSGYKLREDIQRQIDFYKTPKKEQVIQKMEAFAALFDVDAWGVEELNVLIRDGICPLEIFDPDNLKKNKKKLPPKEELHFPNLVEILSKELKPLVERASSPHAIIGRMAADRRRMMCLYSCEEEKFRFDDFSTAMEDSLKQTLFKEKIRGKYRAAIIDEFQDTDPVQWKVFDTLFLKGGASPCYLYLVGDPKQSIYAFRQADIYTYLSAAQAIGAQNHASLDRNFRSTPPLIHALNRLFKSASRFLPLPRLGTALDYPEVKAPEGTCIKPIDDGKGSVHFFLANWRVLNKKKLDEKEIEDKIFFPYIAEEIFRLNRSHGFPFSSIAILIKDSWQSQRLETYLKNLGLPVAVQKQSSLLNSPALPALKDMLRAFLNPRNESDLKTALGGPLFGWTHIQIRSLNDLTEMEKVLTRMNRLRRLFFSAGFGGFFNAFLQSAWEADGKTIAEKILGKENGGELYQDCLHIAELMIEYQAVSSASIDGLLLYLDEFKQMASDEDEKIKKQVDAHVNAVHILTLHTSKGLEYEIVFPLGLCRKTPSPDRLIPLPKDSEFVITPVIDTNSPEYLQYCDEIDAEKMRQLYVGLTRAKKRVYIPAIFPSNAKERGMASHMDLFAAKIDMTDAGSEALYEKIENNDGQEFCQFLDQMKLDADVSYEWLQEKKLEPGRWKEQKDTRLIPPAPCRIPGNPLFIKSYTGLAAGLTKRREQEDYSSLTENPPADFNADVRNAHTLPAGAETGKLLHLILEKIPLKEAFRPPIPRIYLNGSSPISKILPMPSGKMCSVK